jgi:hypothetical protein
VSGHQREKMFYSNNTGLIQKKMTTAVHVIHGVQDSIPLLAAATMKSL